MIAYFYRFFYPILLNFFHWFLTIYCVSILFLFFSVCSTSSRGMLLMLMAKSHLSRIQFIALLPIVWRSNPLQSSVTISIYVTCSICKLRHICMIVNEDRNGFRTLIATTYKINPKGDKHHNISNSTDANSSIDSSYNLSKNVHFKKLKVVLSAQKWLEISPKKKISGSQIYWKLQEWTDVIAERICQQYGSIDCVFSLKTNFDRLF